MIGWKIVNNTFCQSANQRAVGDYDSVEYVLHIYTETENIRHVYTDMF